MMLRNNSVRLSWLPLLLWLILGAGAASQARAQCNLRWLALTPAALPSPRKSYAIAFDSKRGVTVLFGGIVIKGFNDLYFPSDVFGETWEFDGHTWTQRFPATPPLPLENQCMSYDIARGVMVMFGGNVGTNLNGVDFPSSGITWEWDGTNWTSVTTLGGVHPNGRSSALMVYDSTRNVHVLYGGQAPNGTTYNDVWEYDGTTRAWTQRATGGPAPRFGAALAYDSANQRTVLFGGEGLVFGASSFFNDTWLWDGQTATWSSTAPIHHPPGRLFHAMVFDTLRGVMVVQGGKVVTADYGTSYQTGYTTSTWEWDGTDWFDKSSTYNFCCPMEIAAMVYESSRQQTILYGPAGNTVNNLMMTTWALATGSGQAITFADSSNQGAADGSQTHPYRTVQEAATCALGGSTISIRAGDYAEGYGHYGKQLTIAVIGGQVHLH